jgi:hypothetical protein
MAFENPAPKMKTSFIGAQFAREISWRQIELPKAHFTEQLPLEIQMLELQP